MSAKLGRKSVILFYASVRGLLTLKVSDFVLCFSSRFAYSEAAKVWPIYRRRIVPSNGRLMWLR